MHGQNLLNSVEPPALPQPPNVYGRPYQDQLNNIHRLFYNRLTSSVNSLVGLYGGQFVDMPYALLYSTTTQTLAAPNVGEAVEFNETPLLNGLTLDTTKVYAGVSGVYTVQFNGALKSTSATSKDVFFWLARNGTPVDFSTCVLTVEGSDVFAPGLCSFPVALDAGEYIEVLWATTDVDVALDAQAATAPHPGVASAICLISYAGRMLPP